MRTRASVHFVTAITMFACTTPSQEPRRSQNPTVAVQATPEQRVVPPPPTTPRRPPCDAGAAPDAPLLSLQTQGTHGMEFSETTIVACDGQVSVRALRPFSSSEAVVSTLRLDPDELDRGRAIALDMMRAPETVLALPPQGADTMAVAHSDPVVSGRADTSAAHGAAFGWLREVTERARQHPEYTVTLSVLGHRDNTLAIRLANRGRRPISLFVDERETRVSWGGGSTAVSGAVVVEQHPRGGWSPSDPIEPGGHAVLGLVLDAAPPADATVALMLAGRVHEEDDVPQDVRLHASEGAP